MTKQPLTSFMRIFARNDYGNRRFIYPVLGQRKPGLPECIKDTLDSLSRIYIRNNLRYNAINDCIADTSKSSSYAFYLYADNCTSLVFNTKDDVPAFSFGKGYHCFEVLLMRSRQFFFELRY